jgi:hypothetical protein
MTPSLEMARQALIYTLPLYEMARMRASGSPRKSGHGVYADPSGGPQSLARWVNVFSHSRRLLDARDRRVVTPNHDTLYTNAWLDLSDGPLLVHTPDTGTRYYVLGLIDFYTNPFAHLGTRSHGNRAHTFFLHGPGWQGTPPPGVQVVPCPTPHVWVLGRILAHPDEPLAPVHALQDAFRISTPDGQNAQRVHIGLVQPQAVPGDAAEFVRVVNHELTHNPPPPDDWPLLASWQELGLGPGLPVPDDLQVLQAALTQVLAELDAPIASDLQGGWQSAVRIKDSFGQDWLTRARVARSYIGILGIQEVLYLMAFRSSDGQELDGRRRYRIRFGPGQLPEVDAFWSLTLYRKADYLFYDHPLRRYAIGDRTDGLRLQDDGSLCLDIGHHAPDQVHNWLPAPAEPFYLTLRLYLPGPSHLEQTCVYPEIEAL